MDSHALVPAQARETLTGNQPLRARIDQIMRETPSPDPKHAFVHDIWPLLRGEYETMMKSVKEFCENVLEQGAIDCQVLGRTKAVESVGKSLDRREKYLWEQQQKRFESLADIFRELHDLVGLRIVLDFPDDMEKVIRFVQETFREEKTPAVFSPEREVGQSWTSWFGAYQTRNHRVSLKSGISGTLSRFCGVMFEVQLTTVAENLYNRLAHPLLYKHSFGPLTRQDEMVADMSHGIAICYTLCLMYMKDKLEKRSEVLDMDGLAATTDGPGSGLVHEIEKSGARFYQGLRRSARFDTSISLPPQPRPTPPEGCSSIDDLKEWLSTKLEEVLNETRVARPLRSHVQGDCDEGNSSLVPFIVPYASNPDFIGRSEILEQLKRELGHGQSPTRSTSQPRVSLCGLGGIGKTQIAIAYVYWLRETHPTISVFWVHASNAERFRQAYTSIAKECEVPGHNDPKTDVLKLVKTWLEKKDRGLWLMVIDNADDTQLFFGEQWGSKNSGTFNHEEDLGRYLPDCSNSAILVTTRNKQTGSRLAKGKRPIEVGIMDEDETVQLLRTRLNAPTNEYSALSSRLEHLPLALVQAAAFIQENTITIGDYLELLDKSDQHLVDLLSEQFETVGRDSEAPRAVAEAWILSFEQIQQQNAFASELLSLMSLLDRQAIPWEFLSLYSKQQLGEETRREMELTKALGVLKAFSFVTGDKSYGFDIHRLVQLVTRKWLTGNNKIHLFIEQAVLVLSQAYPPGNYENWTTCNAYLPHVYAVLEYEGTGSRDEKLARASLRYCVAEFLSYLGQWKEAEWLGVQVMEARKRMLGEEHPSTLTSIGNLALAYWGQGRWKEAEELGVQVMEASKRVRGEEHPDTLISIGNLASTYRDQGRWKEAEELEIHVMEATKRVLGEEHPDTLISIGNLASTYQNQGRWKEAEELVIQVMEATKKVLGEGHPNTLIGIANLASTYRDQGRWKEAEELVIQVMETRKKVLGEEHPDTMTSMNNLAFIKKSQGRLSDALTLLQNCLHLQQRVLGRDHPDTVSTRFDLTEWQNASGNGDG
ncbi:Kinesin light chain [Madurella mycetomatis]|uniref:Kinesin light chain n=1 Tax=Madurella mycetomatis TaxID=100816 RepID=A0A150ASD8_9PEZI|nr:Kinesin light chain [Madurella mycetomatis]